jgi:hypothetical protein
MDTTTLLVLGGAALVVLVAVLVALNRSWGDFPSRAGSLPPAGSSAPGMSERLPSQWSHSTPDEPEELQASSFSSASDDEGLVLITMPMVRRAAEAALERGGEEAKYIVRDGDQLYFSFDRISDPAQRRAAYEMMRRLQAGEDVNIIETLTMIRQIFSR